MLTFNSESNYHLIGCGIDGETIARFAKLEKEDRPFPMVFSSDEIEHIKSLANQALGFCASFCCKEAAYKALGQPLNFTECELFFNPHKTLQRPKLSLPGTDNPTINDCTVRFLRPQPEEMVAVVHLYGRR